jgi:hypothetical protein
MAHDFPTLIGGFYKVMKRCCTHTLHDITMYHLILNLVTLTDDLPLWLNPLLKSCVKVRPYLNPQRLRGLYVDDR